MMMSSRKKMKVEPIEKDNGLVVCDCGRHYYPKPEPKRGRKPRCASCGRPLQFRDEGKILD